MKTIMVGGVKGGSGKTTIATNLAVLLSKKNDVLLIDADDQSTSTDFTIWRNDRTNSSAGYTSIQLSGSAVRDQVKNLKSKYDYIVIDTGGRDTSSQRAAISVANLMLIPFIPRSFDIWTLAKVENIINEMKPSNPDIKTLSFLNRADPVGSDNQDTIDLLKESQNLKVLDEYLCSRKAYSNAASQGMSVTEYKPADKKATYEMERLFAAILKNV